MSRARALMWLGACALVAGCPKPSPDPFRSELVVDRTAGVIADGVDGIRIRVTLRDASGNPVRDAAVRIGATGGGNSINRPRVATTDESGLATGTLSSTVAEVKVISATIDRGQLLSRVTVQFSPGPAVRLKFLQHPLGAEATAPIVPPVTVVAQDPHGNTAVWRDQVSLGFGVGSGPGSLAGAVTTTPFAGMATFPDLSISAPGHYTLVASSGVLTAAASDDVTIRPLAVTGGQAVHWVTDTGVVDCPGDLSQATLGAWVPRGAGYAFYPGTGAADGTFQIAGVPFGAPYFLCSRIDCFATASRSVDLGLYIQGRPTILFAAPGTLQHTALGGMAPWTDDPAFGVTDDLQMYSSNNGLWFYGLQYLSTGATPAAGSSALDQTYDYGLFGASGFNPILPDAAAGDTTWLTQLTTRDAGFVKDDTGTPQRWNTYQAVERVFGPAPLTITGGVTTDVTGAFTPVPQTRTLPLTWLLAKSTPDSFGSFRTAVNPSASADLVSHLFAVDALPDSTHGFYSAAPDLLVMFLGDGPAAPQEDQRLDLVYGDPYPASWARFGIGITTFLVPYSVTRSGPGAVGAATTYESVNLEVNDLLATFPAAALKPQVSPVTSATIDGVPFFSDQTLTGSTTHVIRWNPPAVGSPTFYTVWIRRFSAGPTGPVQKRTVARFTTTATQLIVPPGYLAPGFQYSLRIVSVIEPSYDIAHAPLEQHWPYHAAPTLSGLLTVP